MDGLWPRGLSKSAADLDEWCKEVAPSSELRTWYSHDPERFEEFQRRYRLELDDPKRMAAVGHLRTLMTTGDLTLLTATKRPEISQAFVLAAALREHANQASSPPGLEAGPPIVQPGS